MKKILFLSAILFTVIVNSRAQSLAINTDGSVADSSAMLDIKNTKKGLLIPRVSLTGTNDVATIASPAVSLLVYNTTANGAGTTAVTPGYYYWNGTAWLLLNTGANNANTNAWLLNGNTVTDTASFIGTTNNTGLKIKTNSQQRLIVDSTGNVGVGVLEPSSKLQVNGDIKLEKGANINEFSTDSTFSADSHNMVPTEKAIKNYLKSGKFIGGLPDEAIKARLVGSTNNLSGLLSVVVRGNFAYVLSYSGLYIFDISDPKAIVAKGFASVSKSQAVAVQDNYAYVVGGPTISVFDISDPANIVLKASKFERGLGFSSVAVQGAKIYVTVNNALAIYWVGVKAGEFVIENLGSTVQNLSSAVSVAVAGNYAYVASAGNNQLCIYDISDAEGIVAKGVTNKNLSLPLSVVVKGDYAYVASSGNNQLCIYDISNPDVIVAKGFTSQNLSSPVAVAVQFNYAYVASRDNNQLCIYDVTNPNAIAAIPLSKGQLLGARPQAVAVQDSYAYMVDENMLTIYNYIPGPFIPVLKGDSLIYSNILINYPTNEKLNTYPTPLNQDNFTTTASSGNHETFARAQNISGITTFNRNLVANGNAGIDASQPSEKPKKNVKAEVAATDANGFKSIDYSKLTAVLAEALKAQQQEIDTMKQEIHYLKERLK